MCYESESKICSKTIISTVNSLHICWNLGVTVTLCQARSNGGIQGQCPKNFLCPEKFVLNIHHNKNKNLPPLTVYFTLKT